MKREILEGLFYENYQIKKNKFQSIANDMSVYIVSAIRKYKPIQ